MSPELRKEQSELILHKCGIRLNLQLPVIESADEIQLRSLHNLHERLAALSVVSCIKPEHLRGERDLQWMHSSIFSKQESAFLLNLKENGESDESALSFQNAASEALYFLAWCGCSLKNIVVPTRASKFEKLLQPDDVHVSGYTHFWQGEVVRIRARDEILNWSDLLYRLHWAVRHARLNHKEVPGRLNVPAVEQWHKAANWICCYDDVDDWDLVSNET